MYFTSVKSTKSSLFVLLTMFFASKSTNKAVFVLLKTAPAGIVTVGAV